MKHAEWPYYILNKNNVIYNLQFGFRQQYSTSHALINNTENIRKALDDGNTGCGVFADLQIAFDTVDQDTSAKLNHYGWCLWCLLNHYGRCLWCLNKQKGFLPNKVN